MKDPFHPGRYVAELEALARDGGWEIRQLPPTQRWPRPWLWRKGDGAGGKLYVSAGIHGDEPGGPLAILEALRAPDFFQGFEVVVFPMLNPDGLEAGTRNNLAGIDLNRDYNHPKSGEVAGHVEALRGLPRFDATLCLHEDYDASGVYLYELNFTGRPGCARELLNSMSLYLPIEKQTLIDGYPADNGVIHRTEEHRKRTDWPEALYLSYFHTNLIYTCETPSMRPLDLRVKALVGAMEALVAFLRGRRGNRSDSSIGGP